MSLFRRPKRKVPMLNTASLPDLIFTVLFFFMIVTQMRQTEVKVDYEMPAGDKLEKLARRNFVEHIYVGKGPDGETAIQLNDRLASTDEIGQFVRERRRQLSPADRERLTISIKADKEVPMGVIADIKRELRKAGALRINYSGEDYKTTKIRDKDGI